MYDSSSINSSYFADGFSGWISARASVPVEQHARISVCWFTSKNDYDRFLNHGTAVTEFKGACKILLVWEEPHNGSKFNTVNLVNETSPSYYFIGIKVEKAVSSLWYNFTTVRSYYNNLDLGTDPDCRITNLKHQCDFDLHDKKCVLLYAEPEAVVNTSTFHLVKLKGKKQTRKAKEIGYKVIWVVTAILPLVALSICVVNSHVIIL